MKLNAKQSTVLLRLVRTLVAAAVATLVAWLATPDALNIIPVGAALYVIPVLTGLLTSAEKALRYGSDPGEVQGLSLWRKVS